MSNLLREAILDKILVLLLQKKKNKAVKLAMQKDPSIKKDVEKIQQNMAELEKDGEAVLQKISNKYKGTELEKYFNY